VSTYSISGSWGSGGSGQVISSTQLGHPCSKGEIFYSFILLLLLIIFCRHLAVSTSTTKIAWDSQIWLLIFTWHTWCRITDNEELVCRYICSVLGQKRQIFQRKCLKIIVYIGTRNTLHMFHIRTWLWTGSPQFESSCKKRSTWNRVGVVLQTGDLQGRLAAVGLEVEAAPGADFMKPFRPKTFWINFRPHQIVDTFPPRINRSKSIWLWRTII
jgi:hypothetical protein